MLDDDDPRRPAIGVINGVVGGLLLWLLIGLAVWLLWPRAARAGDWSTLETVPVQYDHVARNMIVQHMSLAEIGRRCGKHFAMAADQQLVGCSFMGRTNDGRRVCLVYLPHRAEVSESNYHSVYRHERGHCNGWRH